MTDLAEPDGPVPEQPLTELDRRTWRVIRERTPARILVGRSGPAYSTATWLRLREDHAAARDAVRAEINLERDLGADFVARWGLVAVESLAGSKEEYLLRPDLGRRLSAAARDLIQQQCPRQADVQIAIGDGLSAAAVLAQVPALLPMLVEQLRREGMAVGRPFFIRHCRVGVLNEIGELLDPEVAVLLIGERPGLATAESLSAYFAYRPRAGDSDARRNLISNIHRRGVVVAEATRRIAALCVQLRTARQSGVGVKEGGTCPIGNEVSQVEN